MMFFLGVAARLVELLGHTWWGGVALQEPREGSSCVCQGLTSTIESRACNFVSSVPKEHCCQELTHYKAALHATPSAAGSPFLHDVGTPFAKSESTPC